MLIAGFAGESCAAVPSVCRSCQPVPAVRPWQLCEGPRCCDPGRPVVTSDPMSTGVSPSEELNGAAENSLTSDAGSGEMPRVSARL